MITLEQRLQKFKFDLLRYMPFYGDIVARLNFVETSNIPTAATNGRDVLYNPAFMRSLSAGAQNFVFMHEIFHVLLLHCRREQNRNKEIWNTACDMVVNSMLTRLTRDMTECGIPYERPPVGIFVDLSSIDTVENLYAKIYEENKNKKIQKTLFVPDSQWGSTKKEVNVPDDLLDSEKAGGNALSTEESETSMQSIKAIIKESAIKNKGDFGSYFVPEVVYKMTESRHIKWQTLLRNFFTEEISDDVSYTTPERKYIHMDLILPGHSMTEEVVEEIWAFVDSSGSIGPDAMQQFLTQLYRISKEFHCKFNICYWDTAVTDVYRSILKEKDILKCQPRHSGGTDINCVYSWMKANKVKPDVMLVLTDGYFGTATDKAFVRKYRKKTIVVLSANTNLTDNIKEIGKVTRLQEELQ